jgi:predicted transcriptional regulator
MRSDNVLYFGQREEEFANLLIGLGVKKNVAKVLVYLSRVSEATSREIERGTDLRQPEVSIAMRSMKENRWVESRENKADSKGRPIKIYQLVLPVTEIMDNIESDKKKEAKSQLDLIQQLREYVS